MQYSFYDFLFMVHACLQEYKDINNILLVFLVVPIPLQHPYFLLPSYASVTKIGV